MEHRRVIDRNGDTVVLFLRTWEQHICRRHAEMAGAERVIEQVLSAPDVVTADTDVADRECQYAYGRHLDYPTKLVKVVVQYEPFPEVYR